uniref:BCL2 interacting protein like n=1 Tax=Xiphophorus couchianus TaxID=32473 RepID=A0A3B5MVS2_9TELE
IQDMELREEWLDDGFPRRRLAASRGRCRTACTTWSGKVRRRGGGAKGAAARMLTSDLFLTDDLPEMGRGRSVGAAEPSEGLMELDQVDQHGRRWRRFSISGQEYQVNMSVLEPYLQVLSHGGYYGDGMNAIILFTSCYLPENTVEDYEYVMENLFRYIVGTLDLMVSENYLLVYLCAMAPRNKLPAIKWLHQCYTSIDRRLKKDLKGLLVVHPAWYIKALITLVKPFISDKFSRKIRFVQNLEQLSQFVPTDRLQIPEAIRQAKENLTMVQIVRFSYYSATVMFTQQLVKIIGNHSLSDEI